MVSTRSQTTHTDVEDVMNTKSQTTPRKDRKPQLEDTSLINSQTQSSSNKRKAPVSASESPASKRNKASQGTKRADTSRDTPPISINRAPVLQLWSACVAQHLYPSLPWSTCISAGSAISTICAVAKGRAIGTISERDDSDEKTRKRREAKKQQRDFKEIHVMHFNLKLKDGLALVGSEQKGKPANEDALEKKFGEEEYRRVKQCLEDALGSWGEDDDEQLDKQAFHFYEKFRPTVKGGQKGWGRNGELSLENVKSVVQKG